MDYFTLTNMGFMAVVVAVVVAVMADLAKVKEYSFSNSLKYRQRTSALPTIL